MVGFIPEIGTEVVLTFAYRSLQPYIIGAVYNGGDDKPEPYKNDDEKNNLRLFWSRNDHMIIFDDTEGEEKVELGAQAETRLDVTTAPIYQQLNSARRRLQNIPMETLNGKQKKPFPSNAKILYSKRLRILK